MMRNIELNRGLIYSQKILLKLMSRGLSRMDAYEIVQDISLKVINGNSNFQKEVSRDNRIKKYLMPKEIEEIFDPHTYLINVDKIYKRTGI
jgi:adenylosuccinate lyase